MHSLLSSVIVCETCCYSNSYSFIGHLSFSFCFSDHLFIFDAQQIHCDDKVWIYFWLYVGYVVFPGSVYSWFASVLKILIHYLLKYCFFPFSPVSALGTLIRWMQDILILLFFFSFYYFSCITTLYCISFPFFHFGHAE